MRESVNAAVGPGVGSPRGQSTGSNSRCELISGLEDGAADRLFNLR